MLVCKQRRWGFTLAEILIVVVILGMLAAIVIPQFTNASESENSDSLTLQIQMIRAQLELYQEQHAEQYPDLKTSWNQMTMFTDVDGNTNTTETAVFKYGPYLQEVPINSFEGSSTTADVGGAMKGVGWTYKTDDGQILAVVAEAKAITFQLDMVNDVESY